MANEQFSHLKIERFFTSDSFKNPKTGASPFQYKSRERSTHGAFVKQQFNQAVEAFEDRAKAVNEDLYSEDVIYLEFESEPGYYFPTDSFDSSYGYYKLSYSRIEKRQIDGEEKEIQKIGVFVNKRGVESFLKKIDAFLDPEKDTKNSNPRNQALLANIATIRSATLRCFWTEPTESFPESDTNVWWEVWLRRDSTTADHLEDSAVRKLLAENGIEVGEKRILFPEHIIFLVKGTAAELSKTLLYTNKLAELRKPKETAEFFLSSDLDDTVAWLEDLQSRIKDQTNDQSVLVCLLDSGVNREHPLLSPFLPEKNMHTVKPDWGTADSESRGHGTQMAGNALLGDLTEHLTGTHQIHIYHRLESVKIINPADPNDEKLYGAITIDAASQPVIVNPDNKRVYSMAVTSDSYTHKGEPSSWSSAVDQIVFGEYDEPNEKAVFLISAGNVSIDNVTEYPVKNEEAIIEDPAQAFNAVTIGAYTEKDQIDPVRHPHSRAIAPIGSLSPWSRTGVNLDNKWANKPDVVFEGGNIGIDRLGIIEPDSLNLLTVGFDPRRMPLSCNNATSAATALASKFAAELYSEYPEYWPETIRALIVHSADWSEQMKREHTLATSESKRKHLRTYGYGIPNPEKARFSASDRLTLISETRIKPYQKLGATEPKINEYHLYELPWPKEALESLFDEQLKVNVTLSYFVEPNPGKKEYSKSYSYQSVGLRFKMCRPNESTSAFAARINQLARNDDYKAGTESENWELGPSVRDKGSIHRDWLITTGPELATKNKIAVFPVGGWWKNRKKLARYNEFVRYSLIVSIEAPNQNIGVDLYTPVSAQINIGVTL